MASRAVGKGLRHLASIGGADVHQVLAYDLAHAASAVETARSLLDYGAKGNHEGLITCAYTADMAHDLISKLIGRESLWGLEPNPLAAALPFVSTFRDPEFVASLADIQGPRHLDEDFEMVQDTFRDLPMDALTLLENVLDVSHVPFTHHRTVGRRENAAPVEAVISREDAQGFEALWPEGPRRGKLGAQATTFRAPQLMWHDLTAKGFGRILTVVYAVPIRRGQCRLFARFPFQFQSPWPARLLALRPRWLQHIGNHTVLEDDQVFLHWQERLLAAQGGSERFEQACFLPSSADVYVSALHRWVREQGGVRGADGTYPEANLKALAKMEPISAMVDDEVLPFHFPNPEKPLSPPIIAMEGASVGYDGRVVLAKLNLTISNDDRIGLLGVGAAGAQAAAEQVGDAHARHLDRVLHGEEQAGRGAL